MRELILLRALPGAGKTTFAKFLLNNLNPDLDVTICAADDYFYDESGKYNFDASQLHFAHLSCQQNVEIAMQRAARDNLKSVIIVHNTNTTPKEIRPYEQMAVTYSYKLTSLIVENRHGNRSVHGVPAEAMDRMRNRFQVQL